MRYRTALRPVRRERLPAHEDCVKLDRRRGEGNRGEAITPCLHTLPRVFSTVPGHHVSLDATDHMSTGYPKRTASSSHAGAPWEQLELVVAHLADGITVQDATGRLVYANDAGARMSGYSSPAELLAVMSETRKLRERGVV